MRKRPLPEPISRTTRLRLTKIAATSRRTKPVSRGSMTKSEAFTAASYASNVSGPFVHLCSVLSFVHPVLKMIPPTPADTLFESLPALVRAETDPPGPPSGIDDDEFVQVYEE